MYKLHIFRHGVLTVSETLDGPGIMVVADRSGRDITHDLSQAEFEYIKNLVEVAEAWNSLKVEPTC